MLCDPAETRTSGHRYLRPAVTDRIGHARGA